MESRHTPQRGPAVLFIAWAIHDLEEGIAFPSTASAIARETGGQWIRVMPKQSWLAVGLMGILVGAACQRGLATAGRSGFYRAVTAGLQAHVATHLLATLGVRRYTAGVATALSVMLPGADYARRELRDAGHRLELRDYALGAALLLPAAFACHAVARVIAPTAGMGRSA